MRALSAMPRSLVVAGARPLVPDRFFGAILPFREERTLFPSFIPPFSIVFSCADVFARFGRVFFSAFAGPRSRGPRQTEKKQRVS
jgi:hypothetical protein